MVPQELPDRRALLHCRVFRGGCYGRHASRIKLEFHDADTDTGTDILASILADTPDARFPEVIPTTSSTTRRHSRDDPREDVGEEVRLDVGVRVRVGTV